MTLEVLRNHAEIILTILEVLLYDPLYMWTLTADRMRKVQPMESNRSNSSVSRKSTNGATQSESSIVPEEGPKGKIF
jgi:ataxia telangiectasia mutated family protein